MTVPLNNEEARAILVLRWQQLELAKQERLQHRIPEQYSDSCEQEEAKRTKEEDVPILTHPLLNIIVLFPLLQFLKLTFDYRTNVFNRLKCPMIGFERKGSRLVLLPAPHEKEIHKEVSPHLVISLIPRHHKRILPIILPLEILTQEQLV